MRCVFEGLQRQWGLLPTRREKWSWEGKVTLKLAGEGHEVMVFLGIRKHTRLCYFSLTLQRLIKHCKWCRTGTCCAKTYTRHIAWSFPQRDCLRLTGEKTSQNSESQHHVRHIIIYTVNSSFCSHICYYWTYVSPSEKKSDAEWSNFSHGKPVAM